jgi:hypothetical protein
MLALAAGALAGVPLLTFTATRTGKPAQRLVLVKWTTGAEEDTLGFNLYRTVKTALVTTPKPVKVNKGLILARGSGAGATYTFKDKLPKGATKPCYQLEWVTKTGTKTLDTKTTACSKK